MNNQTRKEEDELMMEGLMSTLGRAIGGTAKLAGKAAYDVADSISDGALKRSVNYVKSAYEKDTVQSRLRRAQSDSDRDRAGRSEDGEDVEVDALLNTPKETMLVWNSPEPRRWAAVSIESGAPKGYYADVTAIGDGKIIASVFDCINIARDEARANGEDFDEEDDTEQHLQDFIEDYRATIYTKEIEDAEDKHYDRVKAARETFRKEQEKLADEREKNPINWNDVIKNKSKPA